MLEALVAPAEYPELAADGSIKLALWTHDDVSRALAHHLPGVGDVAQLDGLIHACGARSTSTR